MFYCYKLIPVVAPAKLHTCKRDCPIYSIPIRFRKAEQSYSSIGFEGVERTGGGSCLTGKFFDFKIGIR